MNQGASIVNENQTRGNSLAPPLKTNPSVLLSIEASSHQCVQIVQKVSAFVLKFI